MNPLTKALLWGIWRRHRDTVVVIGALTVLGHVVEFFETGPDPSPVTVMLAMFAFLLLLGVFNYTESSGDRGLGRFPRRLFTMPVSTLRLVAVPMVAAIASIELLYLLWMNPLARAEAANLPFVAVLLAALAVFYLWALWAFERVGSLRLIMLGVIAVALFTVGQLPWLPPTPPPWWRTEGALAVLVLALTVVAFLLSWRHLARVRDGDDRSELRAESLFGWIGEATSARRRAFANPAAAHFWFEWRSSGMVLPALVGLTTLVVISMSWRAGDAADETSRLLLLALLAPIGMAVPVGIAFSKPTFWSEQMGVPAFVAIRPLSSEDLVAIKMKVAALSAVLSWIVMLVSVAMWLSLWGDFDWLSRFALQMWAFHQHSIAAVFGIALLVILAGMFLTWRFLVSRMWSGLSGKTPMLVGSVVSLGVIVMAVLWSDPGRWPEWLLADPSRFAPLAWIAVAAVVAKYWLAAYSWRGVSSHYLRAYLLIWLVGTASFLALGIVVWNIVRIYLPLDVDRLRSIVILLALLAVPIARVGLAPSSLTRNRHRS